MTQKNKIIAAWIAFCFVVIHVSFIVIYAAPPQLVPEKAKSITAHYVNPLFHQTWAMFAPCPIIDGKVRVMINPGQGDTDEWFYPADDARELHNYFRVSHHAELVLLESNLIYWVNYDMQLFDLEIGDVIVPMDKVSDFKQGHSYRMIQRYVGALARERVEYPFKAFVAIELENVKTGETGELYYPELDLR